MNAKTAPFLFSVMAGAMLTGAQTEAQLEPSRESMPMWLVRFSNLTPELRKEYALNFEAAKKAYRDNDWVMCAAYAHSCQLIFDGNPNVWNLLASSMIGQGRIEEAEKLIQKAQEVEPDNSVLMLNVANVSMARKNYPACIAKIRALMKRLPGDADKELVNILSYHIFLCHLFLDQEEEARACVQHVGPLSDTPLYFYSQALLHLKAGEKGKALDDLKSGRSIYGSSGATQSYDRVLSNSGIITFLNDKI